MTSIYRLDRIVDVPEIEAQARRFIRDEAMLAATALPRAVGRLLSRLRMGAGLSTPKLAERVGRHQPQLVALERAHRGAPRLDTLERFVKGCDAELALVARDAEGRLHVVGVTGDGFAEQLATRLDATGEPAAAAPTADAPVAAARGRPARRTRAREVRLAHPAAVGKAGG
jgi:transcriptional regulator with XRE-family HTH domain